MKLTQAKFLPKIKGLTYMKVQITYVGFLNPLLLMYPVSPFLNNASVRQNQNSETAAASWSYSTASKRNCRCLKGTCNPETLYLFVISISMQRCSWHGFPRLDSALLMFWPCPLRKGAEFTTLPSRKHQQRGKEEEAGVEYHFRGNN